MGQVQNYGRADIEDLLVELAEAGLGDQAAEALGGAVVDVAFGAGDGEVEDDKAEGLVAAAIEEHESAIGGENAAHFLEGAELVGIVVKGIAAGDQVKGVVVEREVFGIADDEAEGVVKLELIGLALGVFYHVFRHVEAHGGGDNGGHPGTAGRQGAGAGADIEDFEVADAAAAPVAELAENTAIAGLKEEDMDNANGILFRSDSVYRLLCL